MIPNIVANKQGFTGVMSNISNNLSNFNHCDSFNFENNNTSHSSLKTLLSLSILFSKKDSVLCKYNFS